MMRIWIDADACPRMIKDFVYKVSRRLKVPVILVANSGMQVPRSNLVSLVVVGKEIDDASGSVVMLLMIETSTGLVIPVIPVGAAVARWAWNSTGKPIRSADSAM